MKDAITIVMSVELLLTNSDKTTIVDEEYSNFIIKNYVLHLHNGYVVARKIYYTSNLHGQNSFYLHRLILGLSKDIVFDCDHKDRNPLNNQLCNLREATRSQNTHNSKKKANSKGSSYKGVSWDKIAKFFKSSCTIKGKRYYLFFGDKDYECAFAYNYFAERCIGEFACLNQIKEEISEQTKKLIIQKVQKQILKYDNKYNL